ncbi:hypothetical protein DM02DRAFT_639353 [Periconia macrospinosa]|uniref:RTA1 domain protein n=1 Tax=Periconia macrospinosa TaxID=97972 RepID=A0A2V1E5J1_9PLEO|nr:hypothetical protein DM02DRAFT_639353 [Periconia macrospinosa]
MTSPDGTPVPGSVYFYAPSKAAAIAFTVLFFGTGIWHLYQCIVLKCFRVTGLHPFCCLLFTVGFALRSYGAFEYEKLGIYIASVICIYCAPPLLELANYHTLSRILYYVPYFSPLHPGRVLTTFGFFSCVIEVLNALGVSYLANPNIPARTQSLGHILMKIALIAQLVVLATFVGLVVFVHMRVQNAFGGQSKERSDGEGEGKKKGVMKVTWTMYASTSLIAIRTIYRVVEHFGVSRAPANPPPNWNPMTLSPIVRYEWFFYVFEATLMFVNSALWNVLHPRKYLPEDYRVYLAQDGRTELMGPGWNDGQNWLMTFIDPFGWFLKQEGASKRPFWETNGFEGFELIKSGESRNRESV